MLAAASTPPASCRVPAGIPLACVDRRGAWRLSAPSDSASPPVVRLIVDHVFACCLVALPTRTRLTPSSGPPAPLGRFAKIGLPDAATETRQTLRPVLTVSHPDGVGGEARQGRRPESVDPGDDALGIGTPLAERGTTIVVRTSPFDDGELLEHSVSEMGVVARITCRGTVHRGSGRSRRRGIGPRRCRRRCRRR